MRRALGILAAGAIVLVAAPPAQAASTLFVLRDPRLREISGIGRGVVSPGVFYMQNDSGDSARFFALDATTGRVRAVYDVPDATNIDWEDLAVAPDPAGTPSVWLGDIGDNDSERKRIEIYRVAEPRAPGSSSRPISAGAPQVWRLRYPDGPHNAESLAVTPTGRAYVITKTFAETSAVYEVPLVPSAAVQTMRKIATVSFGLDPLATGAAFSRDGTKLVVRTYTAAYLWSVRDGDVAAALRRPPTIIDIPLQRQGEGVCIDGSRLVLDSEGVGTAVVAVPLPKPGATGAAESTGSTGSTGSAGSATSGGKASPAAVASAGPSSPPTISASRRSGSRSTGLLGVATVIVVVVGALGGLAARRRGHRRRRG